MGKNILVTILKITLARRGKLMNDLKFYAPKSHLPPLPIRILMPSLYLRPTKIPLVKILDPKQGIRYPIPILNPHKEIPNVDLKRVAYLDFCLCYDIANFQSFCLY